MTLHPRINCCVLASWRIEHQEIKQYISNKIQEYWLPNSNLSFYSKFKINLCCHPMTIVNPKSVKLMGWLEKMIRITYNESMFWSWLSSWGIEPSRWLFERSLQYNHTKQYINMVQRKIKGIHDKFIKNIKRSSNNLHFHNTS